MQNRGFNSGSDAKNINGQAKMRPSRSVHLLNIPEGGKGRLGTGECGSRNVALALDGDVEGQMLASKLEYPWLLCRRYSQDGNIVKALAKHRVVAFVALAHLVGFHNPLNLLKSSPAGHYN